MMGTEAALKRPSGQSFANLMKQQPQGQFGDFQGEMQ